MRITASSHLTFDVFGIFSACKIIPMKRLLLSLVLALTVVISHAGEGMWIPLLLKLLNEAEMQKMGMKMSAEDIYSVNQGSLKDAIVHFGGFCTGEVISNSGLVLTNHHCEASSSGVKS